MNCNSIKLFLMKINVPSKTDRNSFFMTIYSNCRSSPDVNQFMGANTSHETTTCDEIDNPDNSRHKRAAVRRRK